MKNLNTYFRHIFSGLAAFGTMLLGWGLIAPESVAAINDAGGDLVVPLATFVMAVLAGVFRFLMLLVGKKFPALSGKSEIEVRDGGASGGAGVAPLLALFLIAGCLTMLPSCGAEYPITGQISYRDPGSGAKGGLVFSPGEKPLGFLRVPIYDEESGELVGSAEVSGPLAGAIDPDATK